MGLRPGRTYNKVTKKPFTRISIHKPRRSYVKGVPAPRIHQFEMGAKGDYPLTFDLVCKDEVPEKDVFTFYPNPARLSSTLRIHNSTFMLHTLT